jgi:endonuclease/exonuclease/phosphatase family metal-dependent hydrolase
MFLALFATGCVATNYPHPSRPRYRGVSSTTAEAPSEDGTLTVVTFNIQMSERIALALEELHDHGVGDADVIALQEMDRDGTARIAEALSMHWVYYPGSVHWHGRGFGNAILSRWPIARDRKVILPHPAPHDQRIRIAVAAEIDGPAGRFVVYSVHTATVVSALGHRLDQARAVLDDCARRCGRLPVVVAGDFNTSDDRGLYATAELYAVRGFTPATPTRLPTADVPLGSPALDHVFVRRFEPLAHGTAPARGASDHRAVWVRLRRR